jgi:hypothetical protein
MERLRSFISPHDSVTGGGFDKGEQKQGDSYSDLSQLEWLYVIPTVKS